MTYSMHITSPDNIPVESNGLLKRAAVLAYGLIGYIAGCTGLFWLILAMGGIAPVSLGEFKAESVYLALLININLIILFGLQHSIMARSNFKKWITRYIPETIERSTYMLFSGVVSIVAIYFWQPLPGTVWSVNDATMQVILWAFYTAGWAYLLVATFVTNHFELMGLRQVYLYFRNKPYTNLPFTRKYMYRYSRHPMMLGFLIGMWSVPVMSFSHFVMATLLTLYIVVGVFFEERDLLTQFGETYAYYKNEVAALIPFRF